jgi:hypothetical protein
MLMVHAGDPDAGCCCALTAHPGFARLGHSSGFGFSVTDRETAIFSAKRPGEIRRSPVKSDYRICASSYLRDGRRGPARWPVTGEAGALSTLPEIGQRLLAIGTGSEAPGCHPSTGTTIEMATAVLAPGRSNQVLRCLKANVRRLAGVLPHAMDAPRSRNQRLL